MAGRDSCREVLDALAKSSRKRSDKHTFSAITLFLETGKETEIGHLDDYPANETGNSGDVHKPREHHGGVVHNCQIHKW